MAEFIERRELERFHIPEAQVSYSIEKTFGTTEKITGKGKVKDLTTRGVRFEVDDEILPGALAEIKIRVPGYDAVTLHGYVIWTAVSDDDHKTYAVVQFHPFGMQKGFNTISAHKKLESLTEKYLKLI
jgi:hypothetical protein